MKLSKSLVWFRRDLRAWDHAALHHALRSSDLVYCAFVFDTDILAPLPRIDRRVAFIHASVRELDVELRRMNGYLIVRAAPACEAIVQLAAELGVDAVFANGDYEPQALARDDQVATLLSAAGRRLFRFKDQVVFEKSEVLSQSGRPFSVFTPYKNAWLKKMRAEPGCLDAFDVAPHARAFAPAPGKVALPSLAEIGFSPDRREAVRAPAGMTGAALLLEQFRSRIADYASARDAPALDGTSRLSPHLRFGTVSVRHLVRAANELAASGMGGAGAAVWLSELIWREFYAMVLFHHPHVTERAFKSACDAITWETGAAADAAFAAWCAGRTGYPLVDAAMAQLNRTGDMHNRLRMVAASFLVKDLGIDWRRGERYFALHLNDFDLASNNGGWQWAASTGCDAQPYFRIFNPVTQSERFDAQGHFIRAQLPQLALLDARQIHAPWKVPAALLAQKNVVLGRDYPAPIVLHEAARARTLARYAAVFKR